MHLRVKELVLDPIAEYSHIELKDLKAIGTLGVGGFGRVELVQYSKDKRLTFALKCLKKVRVVQLEQEQHAFNEKEVMLQSSDCTFITRLFQTYRDTRYIYFLMEPCLGGDVFTLLQKKRLFDDRTVKFMTACVIEALEFLHGKGFIYRDLKPENLLLDAQGYVKMVSERELKLQMSQRGSI
jgi:cGMP-dependent protein kinase